MKLPGAWWRVEHADSMFAPGINSPNGDGDADWAAFAPNSPARANLNRRKIAQPAAATLVRAPSIRDP